MEEFHKDRQHTVPKKFGKSETVSVCMTDNFQGLFSGDHRSGRQLACSRIAVYPPFFATFVPC